MKKLHSYIFAGFGLGAFLGLSTGLVSGGGGNNGAVVFAPIGAFIGWLAARGDESGTVKNGAELPTENTATTTESEPVEPKSNGFDLETVLFSIFALLAHVWNFQIDVLSLLRILPWFQKEPMIFVLFVTVICFAFPPIFPAYFFCFLSALQFGLSSENGFRAVVKWKS